MNAAELPDRNRPTESDDARKQAALESPDEEQRESATSGRGRLEAPRRVHRTIPLGSPSGAALPHHHRDFKAPSHRPAKAHRIVLGQPGPSLWEELPPVDRSDAQLLAAILERELGPYEAILLARHILDLSAGLYGLARAPRFFLDFAGVEHRPARAIESAMQLASRVALSAPPQRALNADTILAMFRPLLSPLSHEEMHLVLLDGRGRFRGRRRLAMGGTGSCSLYVRDVLGPVVEARAPAFVLVHNHPSGTAQASASDLALTDRIERAAIVVGTRLIDHLILGPDGSASAMPSGARWSEFDEQRRES